MMKISKNTYLFSILEDNGPTKSAFIDLIIFYSDKILRFTKFVCYLRYQLTVD